ncbi:hypothetical protein CCR75_008317 [Bremia lactucae]|uniref:Beta-glucosidase n=1 Tax=Bremia lactucae TaxID=4779 RepID=A0A976ID67_BRELC|nr:hypothetical protein CCR75_008317 [Bremia lactucae]
MSSSFITSATNCFPSNFLFGATVSSLHVPGVSVLETTDFCHAPSKLRLDNELFESMQQMSDMRLSNFHFSITWSRVMQWDHESERMVSNPSGVAHYHSLLDHLQANKLQVLVTLDSFHLPLKLQTHWDRTGWQNPDIVTHIDDFMTLAFQEYGQKVKYWATFHDPLSFITHDYGSCGAILKPNETSAYIIAHNVLRAHARAVALFRDFKHSENSVIDTDARIGIELSAEYGRSPSQLNVSNLAAIERKMQFDLGWFWMPLVSGDYPEIMRHRVGERLPRFTPEESVLVKGSYDILLLKPQPSREVIDCDIKSSEGLCRELPPGHTRDRGIDSRALASELECFTLADDYLASIRWLHTKDVNAEILLTGNWWEDDRLSNGKQLWCYQAYVKQVHNAVVKEQIPILGFMALPFLKDSDCGTYSSRVDLHYRNDMDESSFEHACLHLSKYFAKLATTKCMTAELIIEPIQVTLKNQNETGASRDNAFASDASNDGKMKVPWSLGEVMLLVVVGLIVLSAITCEAIRELHQTSRGSFEELRVLVTIEE